MERDILVESLRGPGGCPGAADLAEYLEGRASESDAHVRECPHCQGELAVMRELLHGEPAAAESADVRWVTSRLRPVTAGETSAAMPWWRQWFRFGPALAALLVVISVGMYWRRGAEPGEVRYGGSGELRSGRIELKGPVGTLPARPAEFSWVAAANAARYEISVEEVSGDPVWKSVVAGVSVGVPAEVAAKMLPGKTLLWRVTAFDGQGGKLAESELSRFRLEPPK